MAERDVSKLFAKCMNTYNDLTGENVPRDPHRNLIGAGSRKGFGKAQAINNSNTNPTDIVNLLTTALSQVINPEQVMANKQAINSKNGLDENAIAAITQQVINEVRMSDNPNVRNNPQVVTNMVKSKVNSIKSRNDARFHNDVINNVKKVQSFGLSEETLNQRPEVQDTTTVTRSQINNIVNQLSENHMSDLLYFNENLNAILNGQEYEKIIENQDTALYDLIEAFKLLNVISIDHGYEYELKLTKLGKHVLNALTKSQ